MRLSAFVAAFLLPFAVAALPLLTIVFDGTSPTEPGDTLALTDVSDHSIDEGDEAAPMAYGASPSASSLDCHQTSIVAIEG